MLFQRVFNLRTANWFFPRGSNQCFISLTAEGSKRVFKYANMLGSLTIAVQKHDGKVYSVHLTGAFTLR
jgi:hypothetical protein